MSSSLGPDLRGKDMFQTECIIGSRRSYYYQLQFFIWFHIRQSSLFIRRLVQYNQQQQQVYQSHPNPSFNKMATNRYLQHLQNTSPAKTTYSFSRGSRFDRLYYESPNKFYDSPNCQTKRSTSLGFGKKIDFVNRATMDPGTYQFKGEFQLLKLKSKGMSKSTFGESHENIYLRKLNQSKTPGPGQYYPQNYKNRSKFYMGSRLKSPLLTLASSNPKLGPQSYTIEPCLQKVSKYKATKTFRIKTQSSAFSKTKTRLLEQLTHIPPGPGAYNPEKLLALESLMEHRGTSFTRERRLKTQTVKNIGPGSYQIFSVFGDYEQK